MKNIAILALALTAAAPYTAAYAQDLTADIVNSAALDTISGDRPDKPVPEPAIVRLQVLLDRAGASPGVIDGLYGDNVGKAIAGLEVMNGLPVDGKLDPAVLGLLGDQAPAMASYVVSADDAKDIVEDIPKDYAKQAEMKHLGYTSVAEKLSERFHMDIDLLKSMNPASKFAVGDTVVVAQPGEPRQGKVKHIEARRGSGQVLAFAEDGKVLAVYPATIGSDDNPTPSGSHKVNGVARMPVYSYNPKVNFQQGDNKKRLTLPSGPNNPVGTVWIDLSEPTYGIHGTPEPSMIDKSGSHGCVRLANWDVEELAALVKPGVMVDIVE